MADAGLIYKSSCTAKGLWQEYRVYEDRLELDLHAYGTLTVPFTAIKAVQVRPPVVILDLFRGKYPLTDMLRTLKLDLADFTEHVVVEKTKGIWKQLRITPDNPEAFKEAFDKALQRYQGKQKPQPQR